MDGQTDERPYVLSSISPKAQPARPQAPPARPQAWLAGPEGGQTDGRTNGWTDKRTDGRKSPHSTELCPLLGLLPKNANISILFLGSGSDMGQSLVEWGDFSYVRTSIRPPLWAIQPGLRPSHLIALALAQSQSQAQALALAQPQALAQAQAQAWS